MSDTLMLQISRQQLEYWRVMLMNGLPETVASMITTVLAQEAGPVVERQDSKNQCDGCMAGKPLENGNRHRMGSGAYPDFMSCAAKLYTSPPAPGAVKPVVWRVPVNGDWFYGTKEQCVRERSEFESTFTAEDFEDAGVVTPEPLACLDKVKELNQ